MLHFVVDRALGVGTMPALWWTDLGTVITSAAATFGAIKTALWQRERHNRIAWLAIAAGLACWLVAAIVWSVRELGLGDTAPAPTWMHAPFYFLAPSFALALMFYRRQRPSRALQLRQIADLGLLSATIAIAGTLLFAPSLRHSGFTPYVLVALGYPGFYLAVVLFALGSLGRGSWGPRRIVLGILIWANLAFAAVDVMYGANALIEIYQTGIEDTLWILGFVSMCWAAAEERALIDAPRTQIEAEKTPSWNAIVGAIALIVVATLAADTLRRLEGGVEWTIIGIAVICAAGFIGLRMWTGERAEDAYLDAIAVGEEKERALTEERTKSSRLRAVSSLAGGTAHELNNLLQAIAGSLALLRRRAARGEDVSAYVHSIEKALARLGNEVDDLRKLSPPDSPQGMILLLPGGDRDGKLAAVLAEAGFAPASLPDLDAAQRAAKGPGVRALVASHEEAVQLTSLGFSLPIICRDSDNILDAVVAVVELVSEQPDTV
jgi:signal transduction histidine kinase